MVREVSVTCPVKLNLLLPLSNAVTLSGIPKLACDSVCSDSGGLVVLLVSSEETVRPEASGSKRTFVLVGGGGGGRCLVWFSSSRVVPLLVGRSTLLSPTDLLEFFS